MKDEVFVPLNKRESKNIIIKTDKTSAVFKKESDVLECLKKFKEELNKYFLEEEYLQEKFKEIFGEVEEK